jgi:hypothetical protein
LVYYIIFIFDEPNDTILFVVVKSLLNMNRVLFIFWILFFISSPFLIQAQVDQNKDRKMLVYLPGPELDENYNANKSSLDQLISVTGIPTDISDRLDDIDSYGFVLFPQMLKEGELSTEEINSIIQFVSNGGGVMFSGVSEPLLFPIVGIEEAIVSRKRYYLNFTSSIDHRELRWIDDEYEREIKLGASTFNEIFPTCGFKVSSAEVLAIYRDSKAGLIKNTYGSGHTYALGFCLRDVIIRNLLNKDYNASRAHPEIFEATSDVIMLLIRGIYAQVIGQAVWLSPSVYDSKSVVTLSHDICTHTHHILSNDFAQVAYENGFSSTFFVATHQFEDDIYGDNYSSHTPQLQLLSKRNNKVGSLGYGYFPDYDNPEIFPEGDENISVSDYHPYYSNEYRRTIGGSVYGELKVSRDILEQDLNHDIKFNRSGRLLVNPRQYDIMEKLGYEYSSAYTSRGVLTNFPYFVNEGQMMNGKKLSVMEFPITCSDIFCDSYGEPIDEINWQQKADLWVRVAEKFANNNSPSNFLIYPNRNFKIDAVRYLLNELSEDIYPLSMEEFLQFWKAKEEVAFSNKIVNDTLKIYANQAFFQMESFSFVLDYPNNINIIELYDEQMQKHELLRHDYHMGTAILYQADFNLENRKKSLSVNEDIELRFENYPNPFSFQTEFTFEIFEESQVQLVIYDMYGRKIETLVDDQLKEGIYNKLFNAFERSRGMYIAQLTIKNSSVYERKSLKILVE